MTCSGAIGRPRSSVCAWLPVGGDGGGLARLARPSAARRSRRSRRVGCQTLAVTQNILGLDRERRLGRLHLEAGLGAAHLEAERKSADGLRAAGVDAPGPRLARAPAGDHALRRGPPRNTRAPTPGRCDNSEQQVRRRYGQRRRRGVKCPGESSACGRVKPRMRRFEGCQFSIRSPRLSSLLRPSAQPDSEPPSEMMPGMDPDFDHAARGPLGVRLRLADLAAGLRVRRARAGATSSDCTARCASIRSCIAARRNVPAWCSASTRAAPAAASPIASRRSTARRR